MAGTIVVDRIESDASYASTINVAGQITFSNTVNFGAFAGTAPVAGFYLPQTNNLAFTTASTERMRIDPTGNVSIGSTGSSGARLRVEFPSGTYGPSNPTQSWAYAGKQYVNIQMDGSVNPIFNTDPESYWAPTATMIWQYRGTERMRINSLGYVTQPYQSYAQLVYSDATGILRNNLVPWSSTRVNRNSAYNSSTKYFTAPVAGIYFVSWSNYRNTGYTAGTGDVLQILKNGTAYVSSYYSGTVVGTVECAANDTIGFYYNNDGGATYLKESYASIWLLG
jgi:hypothetical protein